MTTTRPTARATRSREARHHDPLHVFGHYLREAGVLDDAGVEEMRAAVKSEIEEALAAAWEAADPEPESALRHVFAERDDGGDA